MPPYRVFRPPHLLTDALRGFQRTPAGRDFGTLVGFLPDGWTPYVMGGLLRDLLLQRVLRIQVKPSDIDVVIFGANSISEIQKSLGNAILATNAFGGVKCRLRPRGAVFDLWRVEDHTGTARTTTPHTIEQLLRHNLLDIDAIAWNPKTDCLYDCGCLKAITAERIGLQGPEGISRRAVAPQIAHVLSVAYKTSFPLSNDVRSFIADASYRSSAGAVAQILERKIPEVAGPLETLWKDILSGGTQACPTPTKAAKRNSSSLNTRH